MHSHASIGWKGSIYLVFWQTLAYSDHTPFSLTLPPELDGFFIYSSCWPLSWFCPSPKSVFGISFPSLILILLTSISLSKSKPSPLTDSAQPVQLMALFELSQPILALILTDPYPNLTFDFSCSAASLLDSPPISKLATTHGDAYFFSRPNRSWWELLLLDLFHLFLLRYFLIGSLDPSEVFILGPQL